MSIHFDPSRPSSQRISFSNTHQQAPRGLASTPSSLQLLQVNSFFDPILEWFQSILSCLFPCFGDKSLSATFINQRVNIAKDYLENTLMPMRPDRRAGIDQDLMEYSKAIIIIKYNGMVDVAYGQMNGFASLDALKRRAVQKMQTLIRDPANAHAHDAKLSIACEFYFMPQTFPNPSHARAMVSREFSFHPDNTMDTTPHSEQDRYYPQGLAINHLRQEVQSPDLEAHLYRFLYN